MPHINVTQVVPVGAIISHRFVHANGTHESLRGKTVAAEILEGGRVRVQAVPGTAGTDLETVGAGGTEYANINRAALALTRRPTNAWDFWLYEGKSLADHRDQDDAANSGVDGPRPTPDRPSEDSSRPTSRPGRKGYSDAKRRRVIQSVLDQGKGAQEVAEEEGISSQTVYNWVRQARSHGDFPEPPTAAAASSSEAVESAAPANYPSEASQGAEYPDDAARDLIEGVTRLFLRERDRYSSVLTLAELEVTEVLRQSGVRALSSSRTKNEHSLKVKLQKKYLDIESEFSQFMIGEIDSAASLVDPPQLNILDRIPDLAGIRVSVYSKPDVDDVCETFDKLWPELSSEQSVTGFYRKTTSTGPWIQKEETSYWAKHMRAVYVHPGSPLDGVSVEVQVTTLMGCEGSAFGRILLPGLPAG